MDHDPFGPWSALDPELIELPPASGSKVPSSALAPVLVRPVPRLRSPVAGHRSSEPTTVYLRRGRPGVELPPVATLRRPVALALLPAAPALALAGWQLAVAVATAALVIRQVDKRVRRFPFEFADGFLPYRSHEGWPHGVQEDNDVRWNWSPVRNRHGARG
jgi:hypothetical protein